MSEAEGLVFRSVSFSRFVCPDIQGDLKKLFGDLSTGEATPPFCSCEQYKVNLEENNQQHQQPAHLRQLVF